MVRHLTEHFREPIGTSDIAGAAGSHPQNAMSQFRKVLHTTMGEYLARTRLAEARRLPVTTTCRSAE